MPGPPTGFHVVPGCGAGKGRSWPWSPVGAELAGLTASSTPSEIGLFAGKRGCWAYAFGVQSGGKYFRNQAIDSDMTWLNAGSA